MNYCSYKAAWEKAIRKIFDSQYSEQHQHTIPTLPEMIEAARQDWLYAQQVYNNVSDDDLIDHAAYLIQAAEKKYVYLLKQARQQENILEKRLN